jgi:hypothetical protein
MYGQCILLAVLHNVYFFSRGDSASVYTFELTEKDKVHSYKTTWHSYLDSLKQSKSAGNVTGTIVVPLLSHLHKRKFCVSVGAPYI